MIKITSLLFSLVIIFSCFMTSFAGCVKPGNQEVSESIKNPVVNEDEENWEEPSDDENNNNSEEAPEEN